MPDIDFAVVGFRPAPARASWTGMDVPQIGIVPQAADEVESPFAQPVGKGLYREVGIGDDDAGQGEQLFPEIEDGRQVSGNQGHAAVLEGLLGWGLHGTQHHGVIGVSVNQRDAEDFQPALDCSGTARPETAYAGSVYPGL